MQQRNQELFPGLLDLSLSLYRYVQKFSYAYTTMLLIVDQIPDINIKKKNQQHGVLLLT